jgi:hypothetical protein
MWSIVYDRNGSRVVLDQDKPKFYLCKRFLADEDYKAFSKSPIDEVVSVDIGLFPYDERTLLNEQTAKTQAVMNGLQILRVYCVPNEAASVLENIDGFDFCGYDLADEFEISALTNCGGIFDDAFNYKDLNSSGLIQNFLSAKKIQADLRSKYPDEEHADCLLFAIWRRI